MAFRVQTLEMLVAERWFGSLGDRFTVRIDATLPVPTVDTVVNIRATPGRVHWFDAATSARVGA